MFEGDGYSDVWYREAERRGLPNLKTTPIALDAMVSEKAKHLFHSNNIYSSSELEARHEIELERYIKTKLYTSYLTRNHCQFLMPGCLL